MPGTTAKLRWTPAAGASDGRYFVYVSRNGAAARVEASVTGTEVTLTGSSGDVIAVSVAALAGTSIGPRSAPSEPIRFGATPPPASKLVISCATCGASSLIRFPGATPFTIWAHPAGAVWDFVTPGRFTASAAGSQALLRERVTGGWQIASLGIDTLTPVASMVKGVFAAAMPVTGDLDGDGVLEILIQDRADNDIEVWQGESGALVRKNRLSLGAAFSPIAIGDLDGDGQGDLWAQHDSSGAVFVMTIDGLAENADVMITGARPSGYTRVVEVADYDGNGLLDLLWRSDQGRLGVGLLTGNPLQPTMTLRPLQERAGDDKLLPRASVDLDGQPGAEIVVQSTSDGSTHLLWADTSGRRQLLYVPPGGTRWEVVHATR